MRFIIQKSYYHQATLTTDQHTNQEEACFSPMAELTAESLIQELIHMDVGAG